jgi:hypothetical protein
MEPVLDDANDDAMDTDQEPATDADADEGDEATTPSQSRSSSIHPAPAQRNSSTPGTTAAGEGTEEVDVFDGYSFKGRHSVLIDDEEEEEDSGSEGSEEEEEEEEGDILKDLNVDLEPDTPKAPVEDADVDAEAEEGEGEGAEPKTPEARPVVPVEPVPPLKEGSITEVPRSPPADGPKTETAPPPPPPPQEEPKPQPPRRSKEQPRPTATAPPPVPEKDAGAAPEVPPKKSVVPARLTRPRREKSGVPALDRHLDEDAEATEKEDDEDDDWDFVEAADGEDRNGARGTSLFARGVVDRYRLAVFRKASTPSQRTASAVSRESDVEGAGAGTNGESPSPSQRRGRTGAGLTFRKQTRQFLRPKSPPPSSFSSKSSLTGKTMTRSNSATLSASSSSGGLLSPSPSTVPASSPSLKSKESAMSMGAQSTSSGENGGVLSDSGPLTRSPPEGQERQKSKKLKKYKENAEKVFSFLSSPRQPTS